MRGDVEEIEPDPTGTFYVRLANRYGSLMKEPPPDAPDRVVLVVRPTGFSKQ